jgi:hypothetical protein
VAPRPSRVRHMHQPVPPPVPSAVCSADATTPGLACNPGPSA